MSDSSGILWPGDYRLRSEPTLRGRALAFSLAVHLMVAALAIVWPLWEGPRIDLSRAFMVSLVDAPPRLPAAAPKGRPAVKEPEAAKPAPAKEEPRQSKADARMVPEPPPKPKGAEKAEPAPKAKPEPKAPVPEKALAKEKVAPEQQKEMQLAQALNRIRSRVEREAALNAAISKVRTKVAGSEESGGVEVAGDFAGASVPLSFRLFYEELWERIQANWALPSLRQQHLKAVVAIRIARDGSIERIELESGSGDERFDRSALSAVRASNPLPPLPGDYLGRWHEVGIRFHQ